MEQSKAFIFRYYADVESDKYLCDDGLIADPDFFSNRSGSQVVPIWSICGVFHRHRLRRGDMIFFLPVKARLETADIPSYICTGVLVVSEILPDGRALMQDQRISEHYKELYKVDLREHRRRDRPLTASYRPFKIIFGDPEKSLWFGPNQLDFQQLLTKLGMGDISAVLPKRNTRNLRSLKHEEMSRLYSFISSELKSIRDSRHHHLHRERA